MTTIRSPRAVLPLALAALAVRPGIAVAQPRSPAAPQVVAPSPNRMVLTIEKAVELALQQQPSLRHSRAQYEAAQGRVDQARVARRPTVDLSASGRVGSSRTGNCQPVEGETLPRVCGGFFSPLYQATLGASASWRIWDFGQTAARIRAAELSAVATGASVDTDTLDVRVAVEVAYLEAVARQRLVRVAEATVQNEFLHVEQARKFVQAQVKDPIEVLQAQTRAATARSTLAQAQTQQAIALANLRAAIGWIDPARSPIVDETWPTPPANDPPELAALVDAARKKRPDLASFDAQIAAAEASYGAAAAGRRPVLSANAGLQWNPSSTQTRPEPTWSATLNLTWALFDGGQASAEKRIARANVSAALAQRDSLLVALTSELEAARVQIIANRANVIASTEAVDLARSQLKLAEARYTQGLGSQIELTDAQAAVTTAEGNLVQAEWQLADAWARLRRSSGQP